jgi:hypothetical protein
LDKHQTVYNTCGRKNAYMSQSHVTTDGRSVSMSWCQVQSGTFDQRYVFFFTFLNVTVLSYLGRPLWREVGSVICQSFVNII